jgi:hypothetical protein
MALYRLFRALFVKSPELRWHFATCFLVTVFIAGCHTYVPIQATLIDSATEQPVIGAEINPTYPFFMDPFHPDVRLSRTNINGTAIFPVSIDSKTGSWSKDYPYTGLWIGGYAQTVGPGINDDSTYVLDTPQCVSLVQMPTSEQVRDALNAAGGHASRMQPILIKLRVLSLREWWQKYSDGSAPTISSTSK